MAAHTNELHAMIAALAGSQALTLDALRRHGSIGQEDIDYILAVTERGIAKAVGAAGPQAVVQMIRICCSSFRLSNRPQAHLVLIRPTRKQMSGTIRWVTATAARATIRTCGPTSWGAYDITG
jgi:hypothetical protein